jgi:sigma-54 dependent transcriptional regulator, acetoin dehydrogenase operon transcriptional activator AcoR
MEPSAETTREAWRYYVETGELRGDLLREPIHRAWTRCQTAGVSPRAMEARRLSPAETAELLARERRLIEAARPYMVALSRAAGDERHAALLSDEAGVLLDVVGDEETVLRTEGFPGPGTLMSEVIAGANGIGTALAEGAYVEIVGPEHFIEGFQVYTCQGLPVRAPRGQVAGVISTCVQRSEAAERIHEILICAARGIEAELWSVEIEQDVEHMLRTGAADKGTFEKLRQDIVQLQTAARVRLDGAARAARNARQADMLDLVRAASQLIQRFQRKATLWRDIASDEPGAPALVDMQARIAEMAELYRTEAAVAQVSFAVRNGPPLLVLADTRDLSRRLFRSFLGAQLAAQAAEAAGRPAVDVGVEVDRRAGVAQWIFSVDAGPSPSYPLAEQRGGSETAGS